jgi:inhibitor of KinA
MMYREPKFLPGGDKALFVEFGDAIDPAINLRVKRLMQAIAGEKPEGIMEAVPTYRSLLVYFDPLRISLSALKDKLYQLAQPQAEDTAVKPRVIEIPTIYGGEFGPDLEFVAEHNHLSADEVIKIHAGTPYLIYMIGFLPGFPYLGGMCPQIAAPRLDTPRAKIPKGSVGIAGNQTGIYPVESPGGWRIIGRTPLNIFDATREPPALFQAGDYLTFVSISLEEFTRIQEAVAQGTYLPQVRVME